MSNRAKYASNASVQVMLFSDRLEVWNPGPLLPPLTFESLKVPHPSIPRNPLLAESLFLARYIERAGTGTLDMAALCKEAGLPAPQFRVEQGQFIQVLPRLVEPAGQATGQVEPWIIELLNACDTPLKSAEIQELVGIRHRETFQRNYLDRLLDDGLLERTNPDKPQSPMQKYRVTAKGQSLLAGLA